jgi:putative flippase GtrA
MAPSDRDPPHVDDAPDTAAHKTPREIARFLVAGLVNTGVGYAAYALFVFLGLNIYLSQALGHVVGTTFNYFSHRHFVFRQRPKLLRYLLSSGLNYLAGLAFLALAAQWIQSPYLAGLVGTGLTAIFSYLSLKVIAFRRHSH